jgi:hypothetical protein
LWADFCTFCGNHECNHQLNTRAITQGSRHSGKNHLAPRATDSPPRPGSVVWVSHWAFEGTGASRFPATPQANPDRLLWLSPAELLPEWEFLHRQPLYEFWVLLLRQGRRGRESVAYLSDPWNQVFGPTLFRFESLGELTYFLERSAFNTRGAQVGFMRTIGDLPRR